MRELVPNGYVRSTIDRHYRRSVWRGAVASEGLDERSSWGCRAGDDERGLVTLVGAFESREPRADTEDEGPRDRV